MYAFRPWSHQVIISFNAAYLPLILCHNYLSLKKYCHNEDIIQHTYTHKISSQLETC